jgi:hypothetical protein
MVVYHNYKSSKENTSRLPTNHKINKELIKSLQNSPLDDKVAICEIAQSYICTQHVFKPNAVYSQFSYNTCADVVVMGRGDEEKKLYCLDIIVIQNNSENDKESEEFHCYNHILGENEHHLIKSTAATLSESLGQAVQICRQLLNY